MARRCDFGPGKSIRDRQTRIRADEAYGSALGAGSEQCALRTTFDLDTVNIEHHGEWITEVRCSSDLRLNRGVVDVDADGGRADRGIDASYGDVRQSSRRIGPR